MVVPLGPGKFYGSSLPRPRIYTDIKFNDQRVDPPVSVNDPLMSWANEAHWSMGGLSFNRHRLQGRIEGNIQKLRSEREKASEKRAESEILSPLSAPAIPLVVKRKRRLVDDVDEEEDVAVNKKGGKKKTVRKLKDEFDLVVTRKSPVKILRNEEAVGEAETRSHVKVVGEEGVVERVVESGNGGGLRISRRLVKGAKAIRKEARVVVFGKRMSPRLVKSLFT